MFDFGFQSYNFNMVEKSQKINDYISSIKIDVQKHSKAFIEVIRDIYECRVRFVEQQILKTEKN